MPRSHVAPTPDEYKDSHPSFSIQLIQSRIGWLVEITVWNIGAPPERRDLNSPLIVPIQAIKTRRSLSKWLVQSCTPCGEDAYMMLQSTSNSKLCKGVTITPDTNRGVKVESNGFLTIHSGGTTYHFWPPELTDDP